MQGQIWRIIKQFSNITEIGCSDNSRAGVNKHWFRYLVRCQNNYLNTSFPIQIVLIILTMALGKHLTNIMIFFHVHVIYVHWHLIKLLLHSRREK